MKSKVARLEQALEGRVRDHHRFLLAEYLDEWEALGERIRRIEAEIDEQIRPFESAVALWQTIPGVDRVTACNLVAEIGVDMKQFPTAPQLASWSGLCPGNHESAGKRKSGRTRDGNKWLRRERMGMPLRVKIRQDVPTLSPKAGEKGGAPQNK